MRIVVILFLAIVGCNSIESGKNSTPYSAVSSADSNTISVKNDFTKDSAFTIHFPKDSSSLTVTCTMKGIGKPVTVIIPVKKGNQLSIVLIPEDANGNIRINQIFTPDGKADGPFGKRLTRKITEAGNYKVIIGEDQMQGEEWKGKFSLTGKVE